MAALRRWSSASARAARRAGVDRVLDAVSAARARLRAAPRAEASARPQMVGAVRRSRNPRPALRIIELSGTGRARRREARPPDQGGAGSRRPAGAHRGWPARGRAGAQRRATLVNDLSRKLEQWTGRRWTVIVSNEAGQPTLRSQNDSARRTSASAPPRPIRGCRRCWRAFPAPRWSRCASLPPSRRNPMLVGEDSRR